ncbi:MAG: VWA domain-containing protein [Clostridia bacterium]|nr:VWA domain-containing protein [Clostridia bacterium]
MKKNDLREALRNVDPGLIKEAKHSGTGKNIRGITTAAVCVLVAVTVLAGVIAAVPVFRGNRLINNGGLNGHYGSGDNKGGETMTGPFNDGVIGGGKNGGKGYSDGAGYKDDYAWETEMPAPVPGSKGDIPTYSGYGGEGYTHEAFPSEDAEYHIGGNVIDAKAGTLTAKEWRDRANMTEWFKLINENNWYGIAEARKLFANRAVTVKVTDGDAFCFNRQVDLYDGDTLLATARTDIYGSAVLCYNILSGKAANPDRVEILGRSFALDGKNDITLDIAGAAQDTKKLDLMLMVDTTGSMGDELLYINEELKDMVTRISSKDESLSIRVSVNFYRDEGDEYVVKYYDFRTNVDDCVGQLSKEYASGGGDFPEAVHTALENVVTGHQWRNDAVKLCFFVLDAPPHTEGEIPGIGENIASSLTAAQREGIRIAPVFCSGSDKETEYILRSFAVITGGTFVYLTDDSGVGGHHEAPEVGESDVEFLNECMIRIASEYIGIGYEPPVVLHQGQDKNPGNQGIITDPVVVPEMG